MAFQISQVIIDDTSDRTITGVQVYDRDNGGVFVVPAGTSFPSPTTAGELFWRSDESLLYRRDDLDVSWDPMAVSSATIDHGSTLGLGDDDHTQYQTVGRANTWLTTKNTANLAEGSNLYYTDARVNGNTNVSANTAHRGVTGNPHGTTAADVGAIPLTQKGAVSGVATLDVGGKIPVGQIPAIALPQVFVVANNAARIALTVQEGDEAIQLDTGAHWIWNGSAWFIRPGAVAAPNDTFSAADTAGGLSLDSGWTDIPLNTVNHTTVGAFTFTAPSATITVLRAGVYVIASYGSTVKTSNNNRSASELRTLVNTGSGFVVVSGTSVAMYNRDNSNGSSSAGSTVALDLPANAVIKIQMRTLGGNNVESRAQGSGVTITSTRGQKGDQGVPGAGSTLTLKDEGSVVAGSPHTTLNFVGGLVAVTNAGGGQANVTITTPVITDQEVSATALATTTSSSYILMNSMTLTVGVTGNYFAMFSASLRPYQGLTAKVALYVNGVFVVERGYQSPWFYPGMYSSASLQRLLSLTVGDVVTVRWLTPSDSVEVTGRTLTLLKR